MPTQKISPFLWFDTQAEEAARFYTSLFKGSRILSVTRYGAAGPGPEGSVMTVAFRLAGQQFVALNGGPVYRFSPAVSFVISCRTQAEIDALWRKLGEGGAPQPCGWVTDRFGLSWQVVPTALGELLSSKDAAVSQAVMKAMLGMGKLDIDALKQAAASAKPPRAARGRVRRRVA